MSIYTMAAGTAFIAAADKATAGLIAATEGLFTQIGGAAIADAPQAAPIYGSNIQLGGYER